MKSLCNLLNTLKNNILKTRVIVRSSLKSLRAIIFKIFNKNDIFGDVGDAKNVVDATGATNRR